MDLGEALEAPHTSQEAHMVQRHRDELKGSPRETVSPAQHNLAASSSAEGRSQEHSRSHRRSKDTYLTAKPLCDGVSSSSFRNIPEGQKETPV